MKTTKNKRRNKRFARKRALRTTTAMRDSMSAARREWGRGKGK